MLIAARSSKLRAFRRLAMAMAVWNASSAGAVSAGSRFDKIFAADAVQESVGPEFSRLARKRQRRIDVAQSLFGAT